MGSLNSKTVSIMKLDPGFFEFTGTKGVLRVLKGGEDMKKAKGLLFDCPRCKGHKKNHHAVIFIFDFEGIDPALKPAGRFVPRMHASEMFNAYVPVPFPYMTLQNLNGDPRDTHVLKPDGITCGWQGSLIDGNVTWEPTFLERRFPRWK